MRNKLSDQPILLPAFRVFETADSQNKFSSIFKNSGGISKNELHPVYWDDNTYKPTKAQWNLHFERDREFLVLLDVNGHSLLKQSFAPVSTELTYLPAKEVWSFPKQSKLEIERTLERVLSGLDHIFIFDKRMSFLSMRLIDKRLTNGNTSLPPVRWRTALGKMSGLSGSRFLSFPAPPFRSYFFAPFGPMPSRVFRACPAWLKGNGNDCYSG